MEMAFAEPLAYSCVQVMKIFDCEERLVEKVKVLNTLTWVNRVSNEEV